VDTFPNSMRTPVSLLVVPDHVTKDFGDRLALDSLSINTSPGEFAAVIGRPGAGKTTFLRCLSRFTPVTGGAIRFGVQELAS
jgi:ABC-type multidrug transport system ATPase subunit